MESVRNLEDETFPSFLLQSERGNSSEMLENVTVSSNFGLPMAASTVAKDKSDSGKRPPDVQSSYLEEGRFSTVDAHPSNVSNSETCQKFALSFKDELEHVDDFLDAHCIPDVMEKLLDEFGSLPSKGNLQHALPGQYNNGQDSKLETFSVGKLDERSPLDCLTDNEKTNKVDGTKDPGTTPATKQMDDDLGIRRYSDSLASLLEDERLLSLASLEDQSSDDDEFAAEAFGDERLEAYFKQLVPPGTQRGHTEGQELPEVHAAFQVTSNNPTRWHQGNFQMPPVRQEATGMDSAPSSGPDTEDELEAAQQSALQVHLSRSTRQLLGESNHPSFRPGLEGGSSDESIGPLDELNDIGFEFRRGAEGQVINSPVGGGGGDGSSGNEEDGNIGASASLSNSTTYGDRWGCKMVDRNVAGEEGSHDGTVTVLSNTATVENLQGLRMMDRNVAGQDESHTVLPSQGDREFADQNETEGRLDPVGNGKVITAVPGIPLNLPSRRSSTHHQETLEAVNTTVRNEMKLDSVYFRAVSGNVTTDDQLLSTVEGTPFRLSHIACTPSGNGITDLRDGPCGDIMGHTAARGSGDADESFSADLGPPLAAAYLSPVYPVGSASEMWRDSSKSSPFHKQQKADWSTGCSQWDNEKGQRQSVVYQNEEGNWVTDLAYYYSLDKEQDHFSLPTDLVDSIQEETFITGNKAIALIEEDQEEFEEENKFIKDDKMDATLMDGSLGNDSWQLPANSYLMLRASQAGSDFMQGSQSYLRLTLGEFFSERSEALGCLGEQNSGIKRPSFGYSITSPERRAPVVLFEADVSKDHSETSELCNDNALHSAELRCTDQETIAEITTMFPTDEQTGNDKFQIDKEPTSGIHMNESGNMQYMSSPVKVEEPRACNGTDSVLSISTIASAIADASVSADPSQLAAMILELSNKNRKKSELAAISTKPNAELQDQKSNMKDLGVMVEKICERSETNESQVLKSEFKQTSESVSTCSSDSVGSSENSRNPPSMSNSFSEKSSLSSTSKEESKKAMLLNEELCQNNPKNDSSYCTSKNTCQSVKDRNRPHGQNDSTETCTPESSRFQGHKGGYSQFTNAKWMTKEGFVNNRAFSSGNAMTEVPNINCTVSVVEKHEESPSAISEKLSVQKREVGAYLDKSLHKAKAESVSEMKQKDVKKMFSEMSYERVLRIEHQDLKMPVSPELTAVHGVTVSNSSLHHPKLQTIEPVEQTFTESVSEDNKEMEVISKLQGERDEQESSNFNNQEVCVNFQQYHQAPVAPKNSTADHTCAADQLNLRPLTHSSPGQVSDFPTPTSSSSSLTHSSANLTRLSYISGIDATLQNSTAIGSPVNSENDKTIELSTTIIRSSPTPTPDQTIVNSSDLTFSSSLEGPKSCEQDLQERKLDYDKQPSDQTKSPESQDGKARGSQTTDNLTSPQSEKAKIQPSQVLIPEELKFPNSCCVGIASQTSLSMFNPTERWMQVSIGIVSVLVNGEKMDAFAHQCWIFKNKTIIGPHVTEDLKLMFLPRHSGIFQCIICVSSYPVSSDVNTIVRAEALARRVVITAVAEDPLIEVLAGKNRSLDFGDLVPGSDKVLSLKLINRTHATVPIRLVISANAAAWRCFTFCKPDALAETALRTESTSPLVAPSVMNHVMPASYEGEDPESFILWVHFHAPQKYIRNADPLGAAEDYFARVDIEVDTPGPCTVINSLPLCARVGIARIHAPKDLQMLVMCAQPGMMAKQILPLKNAGNIDAQLQIQTAESCFLAKPENLLIRPGEELEVVVSFIPPLDTQNVIQSHLTILVQPFGPQYQVALKGLLGKPESVQSITSSSNSSIGVPPILSNKQFMSWGGVSLGRAVQQKLILRNNSSSVVQQLRLLIKGQDQDCFQLQSTFGPEERRSGSRELMICPKEDVCVHLLFAPTRVACMLARLEIKQSGMHSGQPGVKFTIPLSGYGGTSNIILEDVDKQSDGYVMNLNGITPDRVTQLTFRMRNTGSRAAYVQAACFSDFHMTTFMTTNAVHVSPAQFVLKERTQETITVTCHSNLREYLDCKTDPTLLCRVCFFWGDEVARQQLRRALSRNRHAHEHLVCNDSPLRKMNFNQTFPGEELIFEKVYDIPKRTNDIKIFYANLKKVTLSVTGSSTTEITSEALDSFSSSHSMSVESESVLGSAERNPSNTSLDVLPVRGPHGSPLSLNASNQMLKESPKQKLSWSIRPEYLILTVPSADGSAQTGRVQIINHSPRSLPFEMSWPAHSLTVTPQHGVVDPESHLLILVSPNPSLIAKPSAVPWSGKIYVQCDNIQQLIKVQIREDVIMDTSASVLSPSAVLDTELWTPNLNLAKPLLKSPPTKLKIKNRTVHFPLTTAGSTSESLLEIENGGEDTVQWFLSSFAPPYVKWVDESGDIYRATYTVFRCSRLSGTLQGLSKEKLPIMFMPRDKGDYSQFWDLECRLAAQPHRKHKIQFQLHGAGTKAEGSSKETDSATKLIKTETAMKTRKSVSGRLARTGQEQPPFKGVFAPEDLYSFPATPVGESSTLKINLRNSSSVAHMLKFVNPREPFYIKHSNYSLRAQHYINLPVRFKPESDGRFEALLVIQTDTCGSLPIRLIGDAIRKE
ncbi:centrosomal protein of 192 kDa isoform X6 [Chiloscyllium plagiosum]|uniref:centrosomal protein of 192 kDa isoform X6 n=1 Tax=Chiloscyllium plagiosum TaxID=36176 RepID=UPI001CB8152F|nr:centrosomal protein of 192 kDa isoform X6 [Chiloscyllium plagiosum]